MEKKVKRIVVTGGAGQITYSLLFRIASGEMLGKDQPLELRILEVAHSMKTLSGVVMELDDCAYPLLKDIYITSDPYEAFEEAEIALLVGSKPRGPGMERKDLLTENAKIFIDQGKALNERAKKDVLVFVVGNPCNTNALIAMHHAPRIDKSRFFSMTRLDQNRAIALLAKKANVSVLDVKQVAVWGNHSSTQVPDFMHAKILGKPAEEVICDRSWLENQFVECVQKRGAQVIETRGKSSAASAANAIIDAVRALIEPTVLDDWFSVGLFSNDNPYQIEQNLFFSFPCRSRGNGKVEVVKGLDWDDFLRKKIAITEKELIEERKAIENLL